MEERTLADYWFVLYTRKKTIYLIIIIAILFAVYFSYTLEKVYEATTVFFIPRGFDVFSFFDSEANENIIKGPLLPIPQQNIHAAFVGILRSRTVAQKVRDKFPQKSLKSLLKKDVDFIVSSEYLLKVYVRDKDPQLAADVANAYPISFNEILQQFSANPILKRKNNLEKQINEVEPKLAESNKGLERFREANKTVSLREEISQLIEDRARVQSRIIDARAAIVSMESYPDIVTWKNRLIEYQKEKKRIDGRRSKITKIISKDDEIAREVDRYKEMLKKLHIQLEEIKAQEERETQNVVVVDRAEPPKRPAFPVLWINVIISGFCGLIGGVFFAFFMDYVDKIAKKKRFEAIETSGKI
ncbi:MAG: GumC family protein [Nitrospinota bacterium]